MIKWRLKQIRKVREEEEAAKQNPGGSAGPKAAIGG